MRFFLFVLFILTSVTTSAQVGLNTITPQAALDIVSDDSGVLLPRVDLTSLSVEAPVVNPDPAITNLEDGTLVWNTGAILQPAGYYYWQGGLWNQIIDSNKQVHFGKLIIDASGTISITGIGFQPRSIEFIAVNRVQDFNDGSYRSDSDNSNDIRMAGGQTIGYAAQNGTGIDQQVISNAFSGSSINNIGTYSSENHCIAAFFTNNNGRPIQNNGSSSNSNVDTQEGLIRASLQTFDMDGFTLNVDRFLAGSTTNNRTNQIVVIYKAFKY